jgi:hypothetical protein
MMRRKEERHLPPHVEYKGRAILVRYVWLNMPPKSGRMEKSFSADNGKHERQTGFAK